MVDYLINDLIIWGYKMVLKLIYLSKLKREKEIQG